MYNASIKTFLLPPFLTSTSLPPSLPSPPSPQSLSHFLFPLPPSPSLLPPALPPPPPTPPTHLLASSLSPFLSAGKARRPAAPPAASTGFRVLVPACTSRRAGPPPHPSPRYGERCEPPPQCPAAVPDAERLGCPGRTHPAHKCAWAVLHAGRPAPPARVDPKYRRVGPGLEGDRAVRVCRLPAAAVTAACQDDARPSGPGRRGAIRVRCDGRPLVTGNAAANPCPTRINLGGKKND